QAAHACPGSDDGGLTRRPRPRHRCAAHHAQFPGSRVAGSSRAPWPAGLFVSRFVSANPDRVIQPVGDSFFPQERGMPETVYVYDPPPRVALAEAEETLVLAPLATESLHGEAQARLAAPPLLDREPRACVMEADTAVGRDFNRLFVNFVRRE